MYKVQFTKLAKMPDGSNGNLSQGTGVCYTDAPIDKCEYVVNKRLKGKKLVCFINNIEKIDGFVERY